MVSLRACLLALVGVAAGAHAQPLSFHALGVAEGLPSRVVQAVGADGEGFVWLGTQLGAARYDGQGVRLFGTADGLPDGVVWSFGRGADGALVAGTEAGAARFDGRRFVRVAAVPDVRVRALTSGPGALWAGTAGHGLVRLGSGAEATPTLAGGTIRAVLPLGRTTVVATTAGLTRLAADGTARHRRALADVTALARAGGTVWLGRADGTVQRLDPASLTPTGPALDAGGAVSALVASEARPGTVWVGTRGTGIWHLDADAAPAQARLRPAHADAGALTDVVALHEAGGVLWAAAVDGLAYADATPARFSAVGASEGGLRVPAVMSLHASRRDPDIVWVGTVRGGLHRWRRSTGRAERWFGDADDPLSVPFAIHEAADGALWLGGTRPSLFRFDPATGERTEVVLDDDAGGTVTEITPSRARPGHVWVSTQAAGLHLVDLERRAAVGIGALALHDAESVWSVLETGAGILYAATEADGLVRADPASGRPAPVRADGCPLDREVVALAADGDALWIGGFEPWLARLDPAGTCRVWTDADGLPTGGVGALALDADGAVWVNANGGLARFDPRAEAFTLFTAADGMPPGALTFHAFDQAPDGTLLVGGLGGFTRFRPAAVAVDTVPPPVRFTGLTVDGEPVEIPDGTLTLPHDRNDLAATFAALDFRQPEKTRYRVQLGGADTEWRPSEPRVRYPQLAPGRYTLRVSATGRDGYWSAPAELTVRIRPPVWQTPWFWALVALAAGGVAYAGHRYRIEQILRVERARRRIADDLHDDIGSKISSVALRLAAAQRAPGLPDAERERLGRLGDTARAVVSDLRDTVWMVDAGHDTLAAVADRLETFARQTPGTTVERTGTVPELALGMTARRDLYLLATEALHNAVRHADAQRVAVGIACDADALTVTVRDDGRGFDASAAAGRGTDTMARRADALGGTLTVESAVGAGTLVAFRLPFAARRRWTS